MSSIPHEKRKDICRILDKDNDFRGFIQIAYPDQNKGFQKTKEWLDEWETTKEGTIENFVAIAKLLDRADIVDILESLK
jgi:hypothetical protein